MTKQKHTSGLWRVETERTQSGQLCVIKIVSNAIERGCIAFEDKDTTEQTLANFKHIVDCVNALEGYNPEAVDDLLSRVQSLTSWAAINKPSSPADWNMVRHALTGISTALAKLKENA